jgi:hypothetical protein
MIEPIATTVAATSRHRGEQRACIRPSAEPPCQWPTTTKANAGHPPRDPLCVREAPARNVKIAGLPDRFDSGGSGAMAAIGTVVMFNGRRGNR